MQKINKYIIHLFHRSDFKKQKCTVSYYNIVTCVKFLHFTKCLVMDCFENDFSFIK